MIVIKYFLCFTNRILVYAAAGVHESADLTVNNHGGLSTDKGIGNI